MSKVGAAWCLHGPAPAPAWHSPGHPSHLLCALAAAGVLHGLVNTKEEAGGFRSCGYSVGLDNSGLPDTSLEVVRDVLIENINSVPDPVTGVLLAQLVQDVRGVEASVVTQLASNHLESLGHGADDELLLARNGPAVVPQVLAQLHVYGATSSHHAVVLHSPPHDHDGVMEAALSLLHELLRPATKDDGARAGLGASVEEVEPLTTYLLF